MSTQDTIANLAKRMEVAANLGWTQDGVAPENPYPDDWYTCGDWMVRYEYRDGTLWQIIKPKP